MEEKTEVLEAEVTEQQVLENLLHYKSRLIEEKTFERRMDLLKGVILIFFAAVIVSHLQGNTLLVFIHGGIGIVLSIAFAVLRYNSIIRLIDIMDSVGFYVSCNEGIKEMKVSQDNQKANEAFKKAANEHNKMMHETFPGDVLRAVRKILKERNKD